jgi:hypothetical protein
VAHQFQYEDHKGDHHCSLSIGSIIIPFEKRSDFPPSRHELGPGLDEKSQLRRPQILPAFQLSAKVNISPNEVARSSYRGQRRSGSSMQGLPFVERSVLYPMLQSEGCIPSSCDLRDSATSIQVGEDCRPNGERAGIVNGEVSSKYD